MWQASFKVHITSCLALADGLQLVAGKADSSLGLKLTLKLEAKSGYTHETDVDGWSTT